jgi:hypothetical protein
MARARTRKQKQKRMRRTTRKQKRRTQRGGDTYSRSEVVVAPPSNELDAVATPMSADRYRELTDPERPA